MLSGRRVPALAIAFSFVCGMFLFLPFPGWQKLVGFITSATVLAYAMVPLSLGALRREEPDVERPFRLPLAGILAPASFVVANELILFSGWAVDWKLLVAIAIGLVLLGLSVATTPAAERPRLEARHAAWLAPYLIGLGVISYLSSFDTKTKSSLLGLNGPTGTLPFGWDVLVMAVFGVAIYALAMRMRLPRAMVEEHVGDVTQEAEEEELVLGVGHPA
jgi:amino acid transporter